MSRGQSGLLTRTVRSTKLQIHQRACNLCLPAEITCRRSGFYQRTVRRSFKNCTRTLPETYCPASLAGGQPAYMSRTVRNRLAQIYTEPTRNLEFPAFYLRTVRISGPDSPP